MGARPRPAIPKADFTHFLLYFVAETMRKSRRRASAASGPKSSFCSSLQTREQNFCSSSSWISLNKEDVVSSLASRDLVEGPRNAALSWELQHDDSCRCRENPD